MIKEHTFWMLKRSIQILHNGSRLKLNFYNPNNDQPRPESHSEVSRTGPLKKKRFNDSIHHNNFFFSKDLETAKNCQTDQERALVFKEIAAAAESGIDFSSRWFRDPMNMETIETTSIIPIDLNSLLYKIELSIARLSREKGDMILFEKFQKKSIRRKRAINCFMWSDNMCCWTDFNMKSKSLNEKNFYISCLSPLFHGIKPPPRFSIKDVIKKHLDALSLSECGIPYSFLESSQQWDFSNIWAPNQDEMILMLLKYDKELALNFARKFFNTVYTGWLKNGLIFEKYSALEVGIRGRGGEYAVQSGFGWTNGCCIVLLNIFKDELLQN